MDYPRIRAVEAFPVEQAGQTVVCLRDLSGYASVPLMLGLGAYFIITLLDGKHSPADLQAAFARRFGQVLPANHLSKLLDTLDEACFLENDRLKERMAAVRQEFAALGVRPAAHAGLCYALEPDALRAELAAFFASPAGPGPAAQSELAAPAGVIAPHIDPHRGGVAYAHGYSQLQGRQPPELFIILGTSHYGTGPELFTATLKDYQTPLGAVSTDREFVRRLQAGYTEGDLYADELLHRQEHSIEFQALFLAATLGTSGYQVVPILVSSFHEMVRAGKLPARESRVGGFLEALRAQIAADGRRACIIAGVDFAHVGRKFGDERPADELLDWVRAEDRALIDTIAGGDPEGFFAAVSKDGDRRRICGIAPMYTQLELLRGHRGRLLKYDVALEPATQSAVSFASLVIR